MAKFKARLKVGQHVANDRSKPILDADGQQTGRFERQVFTAGQIVEANFDLASRWPEKFEHVSGSPVDEAEQQVSVAPGGQVSSGKQMTTTGPDGKAFSGPLTEATETEEKQPLFAGEKESRTMHGSKTTPPKK